jgi:hypothetical protein
LALKQKYKSIIKGKITIPSEINGIVLTTIAPNAFHGVQGITEIFFLSNA